MSNIISASDYGVYSNRKLSEIVNNNFRTAEVFEKYGLDFCCKGNRSVKEACKEENIEIKKILTELKEIRNSSSMDRYNEWKLDFLVDYIINNHHQHIHKMIPVISAHANKVSDAHGLKHPEVTEISKMFSIIYKDLKQHMLKEEQILFPYIKLLFTLKESGSKSEVPYFGTIKNPIHLMEIEHESAGEGFSSIRELSNNYQPPIDACTTLIVFYEELQEFESDLHKHIHLENNLLFPKSIALEEEML
ncbi:MAG: iron-sulfur cluster repair di-iron protein [Ignavibacteriaceae bacterium]